MTRHRIRARRRWSSGRQFTAYRFERLEDRALLAGIMDASPLVDSPSAVYSDITPAEVSCPAITHGASELAERDSAPVGIADDLAFPATAPHQPTSLSHWADDSSAFTELWLSTPGGVRPAPDDAAQRPADSGPQSPPDVPFDELCDKAPACDGDLETKQGDFQMPPRVSTDPVVSDLTAAPENPQSRAPMNSFLSLSSPSVTASGDRVAVAWVDKVLSSATDFRYFDSAGETTRTGPSLSDEPLSRHLARDTVMTMMLLKPQNERLSVNRKSAGADPERAVSAGPLLVSPAPVHQRPADGSQALGPRLRSQTRNSLANASASLCAVDVPCEDLMSLAAIAPSGTEARGGLSTERILACLADQSEAPGAALEASAGAEGIVRPWAGTFFTMVSLIFTLHPRTLGADAERWRRLRLRRIWRCAQGL